jgi:truncated hemoglobin YjbI
MYDHTSNNMSESDEVVPVVEKMPRFQVTYGSMTRSVQDDFIAREIKLGRMPAGSLLVEQIMSLEAPDDPDHPLYFWQLFSILGSEPVEKFINNFYDRVFLDEDDDDFRATFEKSSGKQYHVLVQMFMYLDCFGGGRFYDGEQARVDLHHKNGASNLMNLPGAEKWTKFMRASLDDETETLDVIDPRVRPALNSFLKYFMDKYAGTFHFDSSDLHFGDAMIPALSLGDRSEKSLASLPLSFLKLSLEAEGFDISECTEKTELLRLALTL